MADLEIRAFGRRFLLVYEKQPVSVRTETPPSLHRHDGSFDVVSNTYDEFGFQATTALD
jgi:hypothetical protein